MSVPTIPLERRPVTIGFILVPGFALMSYAAATEPFRAANVLAGRALYLVRIFAETPIVRSSSDAAVTAEPLPVETGDLDVVFVCAGGDPSGWQKPAIHAALRRLAVAGVRIGGISGGPFLLALAGLLHRRRFTIHWEHAPALAERFPDLMPEHARYIIDRDRLTCGGGIAPLDMMYSLIAERMGAEFARRITDWFLHTDVASGEDPQRASLAERHGIHHPVLAAIIGKMETTIERPLTRKAMARFAGVSERHLDRLFAEQRGATFTADYRRIRLDYADKLVRQSMLSLSEISVATGFSSASHFARAYSRQFGRSPRAARTRR
jgi:transcriptional regulator GlxA family with amidase domain